MGKVLGIHHLCVNTPSMEKSLEFYCNIIGFHLLSRETCDFGEYAMLLLGNSHLELIQPNNPDEKTYGNCGSLAHFGIHVQNIDEVYDALRQKGIQFNPDKVSDYSEPMGGFRAASLLGPSGEAINLYEFSRSF
jgi:glyoxylase I family protein